MTLLVHRPCSACRVHRTNTQGPKFQLSEDAAVRDIRQPRRPIFDVSSARLDRGEVFSRTRLLVLISLVGDAK